MAKGTHFSKPTVRLVGGNCILVCAYFGGVSLAKQVDASGDMHGETDPAILLCEVIHENIQLTVPFLLTHELDLPFIRG